MTFEMYVKSFLEKIYVQIYIKGDFLLS